MWPRAARLGMPADSAVSIASRAKACACSAFVGSVLGCCEGFDSLLGLVVLVVGAPQVNVDLRLRFVGVELRDPFVSLYSLRVLATDRRADGVEVERVLFGERREVWDERGGREHLVLRAVE